MNRSAVRPRILFVTPGSPFSSASGTEQRSALMLSALSRMGQVDVLQLRQDECNQVTQDHQNDQRSVLALVKGRDFTLSRYQPKAALTHKIERALGSKMADYQLILGRYIWPVCQLVIPKAVPIIADLDDFRFRYSAESPWSWGSAKERSTKAFTHRWARRQLARFRGAFMVSAQDQHEAIHVPSVFLPNVPFSIRADHTLVPNSKNILFVGSLWYQPNADGVDWFLQHVWPHVRALEPEATLTLAGAASPSARARWETQAGVSAPGFVDDLAHTYQCANLVVVPIQSGGGTNIKVLEAMAHARPCLVSSFVAKAFDGLLADGKEMLVARNAKEFSAKAVTALGAGADLQRVADAGRLAIGQYFTHDLFISRVTEFAQGISMKSATQNV